MLDWLSWTKSYEGEDGLKNYPDHEMFKRGDIVAPMHGYSKAWRLKCGGFVMAPNEFNKRQRVLFVLGGGALRKIRENGTSDEGLVRYIFDTHYRPQFTRLDCAYDTNDESADPSDILDAWRSGEVKTHIRTVRTYSTEKRDQDKPANTVYFGSVGSARQIVVYNKAAQLKLLDEALTRVELRTKKAYAQQIAHEGRTNDLGEVGRQVMRDMLKVEVGWYNELLDGKTVDIDLVGRKETGGLMKWLTTQVAGAIGNAMDGDDLELIADIHNWARVVAAITHERLSDAVPTPAPKKPKMKLVKLDLTDY